MAIFKISMSGRSAIAVLTQIRQDTYQFLQDRNLDMSDYVTDWGNQMQMPEYMRSFEPESWWHLDDGYHFDGIEGILFDESNDVTVEDENYDTVWESELTNSHLAKKIQKIKIGSSSRVDDLPYGSIVFFGVVYEGSTYSYDIETEEDFDPKKLTIEYSAIEGIKVVTGVDYENGEVVNQESDTTNKGADLTIVISKGNKPKPCHNYEESMLTPWFEKNIKPFRNGLYEVKKCDEEISSVLLKWKNKGFFREEEKHEYDKNWDVVSTKLIDVEVPFHDIVCWRGLTSSFIP
jgi:hypothetical protein